MKLSFYRALNALGLFLFVAVLAGCSGLFEDLDQIENGGADANSNAGGDADDSDAGDADETNGGEQWSVEITQGPLELTNADEAIFEFQCDAEGACDFECAIDEGDFENCETGVIYSDLDQGDHQFQVVGIEQSDRRSEPAEWNWVIDTAAPVVDIIAAPNETVRDSEVSVEFSCVDELSDCSTECALDGVDSGEGSQWEECTSPHVIDELVPGQYRLKIRAIDDAGNQSTPSEVEWEVEEYRFMALTAGREHTCAIRYDGTLWCWGSDDDGQLGTADAEDAQPLPIQVEEHNDWEVIAAGDTHTCGIRDGNLWCWGDNTGGKLGNDSTTPVTFPVKVGNDSNWAQVTAGANHSCGIRDDGRLWCWGDNTYDQLGLGVNAQDSSSTPEPVGTVTSWQSVAAGQTHTCGLRNGGELYCWGTSDEGALGTGVTNANFIEPEVEPRHVDSAVVYSQITAGYRHSCASSASDGLFCWGANTYGQIGNDEAGSDEIETTPSQVKDSDQLSWSAIVGGYDSTGAIDGDGTLWMWGRNDSNQLGNGNSSNQTTPDAIAEGMRWTDLSSGQQHTCAIRDDGTLWCWGRGEEGQLGLGDTTEAAGPAPILIDPED